MQKLPIYGLDLIRLFAALSVVFYHFGFRIHASDSMAGLRLGLRGTPAPLADHAWWGWVGVQIFFVISGVVIAYSTHGVSARKFAERRIARLLPVMTICATWAAIVAITLWDLSAGYIFPLWLKSVVFFPFGPWIAGQIWTLPIEICFYGLVWLLLATGRSNRLEVLATVLCLASAAYWAATALTNFHDPAGRVTQLVPLQHGCYFSLGMTMSALAQKGRSAGRLGIVAVCGATSLVQIAAAMDGEHLGPYFDSLLPVVMGIWLIAMMAIAASLYFVHPIATACERVRSFPSILRILGLMTYPLYLVHMHVAEPVMASALRIGLGEMPALVLAISVSCLAAWLIAMRLEPPVHRLVTSLVARLGNSG